jgi:hypothetical protein
MALIANRINTRQPAPVRETPPAEPISFIELVNRKLEAEVASKRPLIYNPMEAAPLVSTSRQEPESEQDSEPEHVQQPTQSSEAVITKRVVRRSQYMRDMLTVEKL